MNENELSLTSGIYCLQNNEFKKAKEIFEKLITFGINDKESQYYLILTYFTLKRYVNAYDLLIQSFRPQNETDLDILQLYYILLNKLNKHEDIINSIDNHIKKYPNEYEFIKQKAIALIYLNKYSDSEQICYNNLKAFPLLHEILGNIELKKHNYNEAQAHYENAINTIETLKLNKKTHLNLYINLLQINEKLNLNNDTLESQLLSYKAKYPSHIRIYIYLVKIHKQKKSYSQALLILSNALNYVQNNMLINYEKDYYYLICSLYKVELLSLNNDITSAKKLFEELREDLFIIRIQNGLSNKQNIKILSLYFKLYHLFHYYAYEQLSISEEIIGKGGFSVVYKGKLDNMNVAVKSIRTTSYNKCNQYTNKKELLRNIFFEVYFMELLGQPISPDVLQITENKEQLHINNSRKTKILQILTVFFDSEDNLFLITPLMGEHLGNVIRHNIHYNTNNKVIAEILIQIAKTILSFHQRNPSLIHKDIKPANILFEGEYKPNGGNNIVICDFGLMSSRNYKQEGFTPKYAAPELFLNQKITTATDVYSFAVLVWEMYSKHPPFESLDNYEDIRQEVILFGTRPDLEKLPKDIPNKLKKLLEDTFYEEPMKRPTLAKYILILEKIQNGENE